MELAPTKSTNSCAQACATCASLASTITRLWVAPTEVFGVTDPVLSDDDRRAVLSEVDRQVCYELSERFEIAEQPEPQAGTVRVGVTYIRPTHQAGSAAAAVANQGK